METTRELSVVPQQGMMTKMGIINPTFIEDAVTVLYPALETTSLQSATRLLYTVLRRRQAYFLQEKLSVIRKSESHTRF